MRAWCGPLPDMYRHPPPPPRRDPLRLDDGTADRLLRGLPPDDAPRPYRRVAAMVAGLTAAPTAEELHGERQAVTTIARQARAKSAAHRSTRATRHPRRKTRTAAFVLACSATLLAGLGAAGALPGAAQTVASDVLASVGVTTPGPDANAGTHPDQRGDSGSTGATGSDAVSPTASGGSSTNSVPTGTSGPNGQGASNSTGPPADAGSPPVTTPSGVTPGASNNGNGNGNANGQNK